jgi:hypothetical protein
MQLVQGRPNLGERVRELGDNGRDSLAFTRELDACVEQLGDVRVREWGHRMRSTHRFDLMRSQHAEIIAYANVRSQTAGARALEVAR